MFSPLGHYEINVVKSVMKLMWNLGGQQLADILGFKSHISQICLGKCTGMLFYILT